MLIFRITAYAVLILLFISFRRKKKEWKEQLAFEAQFERYLSEVAAAYGKELNIEDALWETEEKYPANKKQRREKRIGKDRSDAYVSMFTAVCEIIKNDGDIKRDGMSVFLKNIQYMKEELRSDLLLYQERYYLFLGLDILTILPIFFLPIVELWAVHTSEQLAVYYEGGYGMLTFALLFGVTAVLYITIGWLFFPQQEVEKQYFIEERLLKQKRLSGAIDWYIRKHYTECLKKNELLKQLQGYGNIRIFLLRKILWGFFGGSMMLVFLLGYLSLEHRLTGFLWYHFLLVVGAAFLAVQLPEGILYLMRWKSRDRRMEECLRMQTVVLLLIHYEETTVEELLEKMEAFSEVFRMALARAADTFSYQRTGALESLAGEMTEEPMKRICEALIACDELPMEQAFMNLEGERAYYLGKNQEERRKNQREYAAFAKLAAYLPLLLLIISGMVIPFVMEGLRELQFYTQEMSQFM